jgi:hypothetical protein
MGDLTEAEIFDCLETNFRLAAEDAENLAKSPRRGAIYRQFRERLELIGGACRQAAYWREDTRWLKFDEWCGQVHKTCGDWLRGIKVKGGPRVKLPENKLHPNFMAVANRLKAAHRIAMEFKNNKTGTLGIILPATQPGPHRDTRPVGWMPTVSGLIVPANLSRLP